jgi:hypothetical protein
VASYPGSQTATTVTIKGGEPVLFSYTSNNAAKAPTLITLIPAGTQAVGSFRTDYIDKVVRPFSVVRYMDWQNTTFWTGKTWASRATPNGFQTYEQYAKPTPGVALELIVELANRTKTTPWLCIPTQADDDYLAKFAAFIKANLDPSLVPFVEYSNECWNTFGGHQPFYQIHNLLAPNCRDLLSTDIWTRDWEYVALMLHKAHEALNAAGVKHKTVLAGQAVYMTWLGDRALPFAVKKFGDAKWIDVLSYAGYAMLPENWPAPQNLDDVFAGLNENLKSHAGIAKAHRTLADSFGVKEVALYEAGQHLPGSNPLFVAAQSDPRMEQVYRGIAAAAGDVLINWFCSPAKYDGSGCWGWGQSRWTTIRPSGAPSSRWLAFPRHRRPSPRYRAVGATTVCRAVAAIRVRGAAPRPSPSPPSRSRSPASALGVSPPPQA